MTKDTQTTPTSKRPDLVAYVVTKRGDKAYYHRIGAAWSNTKGGCKVRLEALPVSGELLLLPPRQGEDAGDDALATGHGPDPDDQV
jgi:hypothetical protein